MENNVFKVVLLQALPASGKSEVRNFMANIEPERLKKEFHIGENLQLDDFPYVHMMRRIDNELEAMGQARLFYPGEEPFIDGRDWGTLCCLLNEDYHDLLNRNVQKPDSCAQLLFDRYDRAGQIVGIAPRLGKLPEEIRKKLAEKLEAEAAAMLKEKQDAYPDSFDGKTIIIECARCSARKFWKTPQSSTSGSHRRSPAAKMPTAPTPTIPARTCTMACRWPSCWENTAATIWSIL